MAEAGARTSVLEDKMEKFYSTIKSRLLVSEVMARIEAGSEFSFDFLLLLVLAGVISFFGLLENSSVTLVASMLGESWSWSLSFSHAPPRSVPADGADPGRDIRGRGAGLPPHLERDPARGVRAHDLHPHRVPAGARHRALDTPVRRAPVPHHRDEGPRRAQVRPRTFANFRSAGE